MRETRLLILHARAYGNILSKELLSEKRITFCINPYSCRNLWDEDHGLIELDYSFCMAAKYNEVKDFNDIPALSYEIMAAMRPYESMSIKLGMRETAYPITDYEEQKMMYCKHLRFWDYMLEKYGINALYIDEHPHYQYTYIIYALALIKEIPMLLVENCSILDAATFGISIESQGENIKRYFMENKENGNVGKNAFLIQKTDEFIDKTLNEKRTKKNMDNELKRIKKAYFSRDYKYRWPKFRLFCSAVLKHHDIEWYDKNVELLNKRRYVKNKIRAYCKDALCSIDYYNEFAEYPDYNKKYIYFGLQLTPEATTMPIAGVFSEQYTSIMLLARCAKFNGLSVYVKEHFVQAHRPKYFYDALRQIDNVRLIRTDVMSHDLIRHSVATSTQTGTIILESALMGKPTLVFGKGYQWKGIPNLYEICNEKQGISVIEDILNGYVHDEDGIKRYFEAIKNTCIVSHSLDDEHMWSGDDTEAFKYSLADKKKLIIDYLCNISE